MQEVPAKDDLLNPTLDAVRASGGSASIDEILDWVLANLKIGEDVAAVPHKTGSNSEVAYRLAWARYYLKQAGFVENSRRGVWALTPLGYRTPRVDPRVVVRQVNQQNRDRRSIGAAATATQATEVEPINEEFPVWTEQLQEILQTLEPAAFERLCQRVLRESGFVDVQVTGKTGDGGIDGWGIMRVGDIISFRVLFQCKRHLNPVGSSVVRDFRGATVGRADKALIIATGGFTQEAKKEAVRDGAPFIDLIDGPTLMQKLKDLGLGVTTRQVEVVDIDRDWFAGI